MYRLHIDAPPSPRLRRASKDQVPKVQSPKSKVWAFVWDKIQFVLVSVAVFALIYVVINWQALQMNAEYYWNSFNGVKSPLEQLAQDNTTQFDNVSLPELGDKTLEKVPPLNVEVFPIDMRVVIPRINQNVPVVGVKNENLVARKWDDLEKDMQNALQNGVVHYPGTALPGDNGNVVITGHSSYYAWDSGRFKDVFALLHDVKMGDKIVIYFNQKKFIYEVFEIKKVSPKDVDVLAPTNSEQLTLITCTPMGTNLRRLILTARLVEKG